jgi:hypothetical protein
VKKKTIPRPKKSRKNKVGSVLPLGKKATQDRSPFTKTITLRGGVCDPIYEVVKINRDCPRKKAISVKSSIRWIDTFKTPNGGLNVPYIDEIGRITGHVLYKWSCDPRSLIATTVSTIAKRLMKYCCRHNYYRIVRKHLKSLVGAAAYYAFTKDSHFWDRVLFFSRNLEKRGNLIHKLRLFYSSKWSDHKRFVISQVIFQTNWLLSRGVNPRDKLQFYSRIKRTIWRKPDDAPSKSDLTDVIRSIAYAIGSI